MNFSRLLTLIRARKAAASLGAGDGPALPTDLATVAELLTVTFRPHADFVRALETRLLELPAPGRARRPRPLDLPSRVLTPSILRRTAIIAALVAVTVIAVIVLSRNQPGPTVANANVLADAAAKLLNLHTVRYRTLTEVSHGICYSGFNVPLTEADKAVLVARGEQPVDRGILYGCYEGPQIHLEEGVYDLDNQAFSATMRLVEGETGIRSVEGPGPYDPTYRLYVDSRLYSKQEGGDWRIQPTRNRWAPFTFDGFAQVPVGNLDALKAAYDEVLKLGEEKIDGVRVAHYRASRTSRAGPETVEAWIGIEDGLPRRAVVTVETKNSEEQHLKFITDRLADPANEKYRNDPIIRRGEWPSKGTITYTYTFSDFNEPVEIEVPVP